MKISKKLLLAIGTLTVSLGLGVTVQADSVMYRLYNPNSGEHFYTKSPFEKDDVLSKGWKDEGIGWVAPDTGHEVYRLYNPNAGDHFYTVGASERDSLVKEGWKYEGVSWYSGGDVPVYRAYNPNAKVGTHNYTVGKDEQRVLVDAGWKDEGIAWYANAATESTTPPSTTEPTTPPVTPKPAENIPVLIEGINDFHGNLATTSKVSLPALTGDATGATKVMTGTGAVLAAYLNKYSSDFKKANKNSATFRVEAGDMISASPAESALLYDQSTLAVLHAMNIQVGTLGNHEFDKGLAQLQTIWNGQNPVTNPTSSMDQSAAKFYSEYSQNQLSAGFPLVIANLTNKSDGQIPNGYQPYTVLSQKTSDGSTVKIGVIGVVTTETPTIALAQNVDAYNFTDPATAIAKYSDELRAQGINAIVVLGHTASDNVGNSPTGAVYGETADIINKLNQIDPNNSVDLYVAGHSHTYTNGVVGNTRVVQALSFGMAFDDVTATYNTATNDFTSTPRANIVLTDQSKISPDSAIANIVSDAKAITDTIANQPIGKYATADTPILLGRSAGAFFPVPGLPDINEINGDAGNTIKPTDLGESALGQFITKAQWATANKELNASGVSVDFAITNTGGIRADLNKNTDGTVTWGQAQAVQPFRNVIQVVKMTGQQILNALNEQTYHSPNPSAVGSGLSLQEYGIKYTVTTNPDYASGPHQYMQPYVVTSMTKLDGTPIDLNASYNVAINNFLRGGGDGFDAFKTGVTDVAGFQEDDTTVFIDYIKSIGTIPTIDQFTQEKTFDATGTALK